MRIPEAACSILLPVGLQAPSVRKKHPRPEGAEVSFRRSDRLRPGMDYLKAMAHCIFFGVPAAACRF